MILLCSRSAIKTAIHDGEADVIAITFSITCS